MPTQAALPRELDSIYEVQTRRRQSDSRPRALLAFALTAVAMRVRHSTKLSVANGEQTRIRWPASKRTVASCASLEILPLAPGQHLPQTVRELSSNWDLGLTSSALWTSSSSPRPQFQTTLAVEEQLPVRGEVMERPQTSVRKLEAPKEITC
jgi:hypothetical protein